MSNDSHDRLDSRISVLEVRVSHVEHVASQTDARLNAANGRQSQIGQSLRDLWQTIGRHESIPKRVENLEQWRDRAYYTGMGLAMAMAAVGWIAGPSVRERMAAMIFGGG